VAFTTLGLAVKVLGRKGRQKQMDLSILQKVSEMASEGRSAAEIKQELRVGGVSPEQAEQAIKEAGVQLTQPPSQAQTQTGTSAPLTALTQHHEKVIQPSPGFDPNAK
jgi:hypothetical protein